MLNSRSRIHLRIGRVAFLSLTGLVLAGLIANGVAAQGPQPLAAAAVTGPGFTYQGQLKKDGLPLNGQCDIHFALYDSSSGGSRIGVTQTSGLLPVVNGVFTTKLNGTGAAYGDSPFDGSERWLDMEVRCPTGVGAFTALKPRQQLTAVPYAFALPGLWVQQNAFSPNIIGGFGGNSIITTSSGSVIGGGGDTANPNSIDGDYNVIAGGRKNVADGSDASFIGAGFNNSVIGNKDFIGGGANNQAGSDESVVGGGLNNNASSDDATVGGGSNNTASGDNSTVPGGDFNTASGTSSLAAGHRAKANQSGAFVWADSTNSDYSSSRADQFAIRATNGVSLAVNAGPAKIVSLGERYRDNAIVAWAKIDGPTGGVQNAGTAAFGIAATRRIAAGQYGITTTASASINFNLVPVAIAEIDVPPTSAANVRIVSINQSDPNYFEVYINDGTFALVDNDFTVIVTGR